MSDERKDRLERRKRGEESFEAVIDWLLDDDRDLLAGFDGEKGTDRSAVTRAFYERSRRESEARIERMADDADEDIETPR